MRQTRLSDEKGMVLVIAMILIAILGLIGLAASRNVTTDTTVASNHLTSVQSLYMAEAGLERAKNESAERYITGNWSNFNGILKGADGAAGTSDDGILNLGTTTAYQGGSFAVRVTNDLGDVGGGSSDTNSAISITSTGTYGNSTTVLQTTIRMNSLPPLPGAINLVHGDKTSFDGNSFDIDGRDYKLTDPEGSPTGAASPKYGISVNDTLDLAASKSAILATVTGTQADNIHGTGGTATDPSVGTSTDLNRQILREFVDSIKMVSDTKLVNPPGFANNCDANNCVNVGGKNVCLGTPTDPKITYISKTDGSSFDFTGNLSGVGILVVDGDDLKFKGNVDWTGVVIVLGKNVGFEDRGGGKAQNVRGGILVGEYADSPTGFNLIVKGNPKLFYSQEALDKVSNYIKANKKYSVLSWRRVY